MEAKNGEMRVSGMLYEECIRDRTPGRKGKGEGKEEREMKE